MIQQHIACILVTITMAIVAVIVAFDLCDINTLATAKTWYEEAMNAADNPVVFLVGMKKDMLVSKIQRVYIPHSLALVLVL